MCALSRRPRLFSLARRSEGSGGDGKGVVGILLEVAVVIRASGVSAEGPEVGEDEPAPLLLLPRDGAVGSEGRASIPHIVTCQPTCEALAHPGVLGAWLERDGGGFRDDAGGAVSSNPGVDLLPVRVPAFGGVGVAGQLIDAGA